MRPRPGWSTVMLTFLIPRRSSCAATLAVLTATRRPSYVPDLRSANPPEASISSEISIFPAILMRAGSSPWRSLSLLNVRKNASFSAGLRLYSAMP